MVEDKDFNILVESLTTDVNVVTVQKLFLMQLRKCLSFFLHNLLNSLVISFLIANGCSL